MEKKPDLVQISSACNTRGGAPLGRNRYVEPQINQAKANGSDRRGRSVNPDDWTGKMKISLQQQEVGS